MSYNNLLDIKFICYFFPCHMYFTLDLYNLHGMHTYVHDQVSFLQKYLLFDDVFIIQDSTHINGDI